MPGSLTKRLATIVAALHPSRLCEACLAGRLAATVEETRAALHLAIVGRAVFFGCDTCDGCGAVSALVRLGPS